MRSMIWKRLGRIAGLVALVLALTPAAAQAAPNAKAASSQSSAESVPGSLSQRQCQSFELWWHYDNIIGAWNDYSTYLHWGAFEADIFCQELVSSGGKNVEILDSNDNNDCLAYDAANGDVYLHPNCTGTSYEQWKFISVPPAGSNIYLLENGYKVHGGYYCLQDTPQNVPANEGPCTAHNHQAVLNYRAMD
jgi:hypothetical protein